MKEGWKMVKLGEVCEIQNGYAFDSKCFSSESGMPLIRIRDIKRGYTETFYDGDYSSEYIVRKGDFLIGMDGEFNIGEWNSEDALLNQRVCKLIPNNKINVRFVYYYIPESLKRIESKTSFATVKHLSSKQIKEIDIPLPPLEEQHRIVSILDASFEKIDALKKNAEENLKNAKALFQQVLAQELKPKEGWVEKKLAEIVTENCSLSYGIVQPGDDVQNGIPVVRPVDFSNDIFVKREGLKRTKKEISDAYQRTILTGNEILMCVRGTTGTMGFATDELKGCNVTRGIVPILIDRTSVKRFVYYQLLSPLLQKQIAENTNGTALKQINIKDLRVLKLFMPSLEEQHRIVQTLDTLSEKCRRLEEVAQQTIRECDALKQSILRQAFSGEL